MKRSVGAMLLLSGLGGCLSAGVGPDGPHPMGQVSRSKDVPGVVDAEGAPVAMLPEDVEKTRRKGLITDGLLGPKKPAPEPKARASSGVITAAASLPANAPSGVVTADKKGGKSGSGLQLVNGNKPPIPLVPAPSAPPPPSVQALGLPGQVAAVGAITGPGPVRLGNQRTSVRFAAPYGMKVTWFGPTGFGQNQLTTPGRYNFLQGAVYRLRLSEIPNYPGTTLYPTLEILPSNNRTATFLAHSSLPVVFTDEDFEQVRSGNFVVKVIYLPDPQFQDLAVAGPDEIVSTRLEPGIDPIVEATRRGSVMAVIRLGNIDLEDPNTPAMDAPSPYLGGPPPLGPGGPVPGGAMMPPPPLSRNPAAGGPAPGVPASRPGSLLPPGPPLAPVTPR
jgi:hypothetical protein